MAKANAQLREDIKKSGIAYWQIALYLGVHENTIVRRMRTTLSTERESSIREALYAISHAKKEDNTNG